LLVPCRLDGPAAPASRGPTLDGVDARLRRPPSRENAPLRLRAADDASLPLRDPRLEIDTGVQTMGGSMIPSSSLAPPLCVLLSGLLDVSSGETAHRVPGLRLGE
jgi:hypothetical protein